MKTISITNLIIIGLILFVIGGGLGFLLGFQQVPTQELTIPSPLPSIPELTEQEKTIRKLLGSEKLDTICANIVGEVVRIGENIIAISHQDTQVVLELKVEPDAHIHRSFPPIEPGGEPRTEIIKLNQIQPGEQIAIYAIVSEGGEIVARGITIL